RRVLFRSCRCAWGDYSTGLDCTALDWTALDPVCFSLLLLLFPHAPPPALAGSSPGGGASAPEHTMQLRPGLGSVALWDSRGQLRYAKKKRTLGSVGGKAHETLNAVQSSVCVCVC